jgi:ankyrin repeat protein
MALLDAGASADAVLPDGTTVIQAAITLKNIPFATQIVARGADVNKRDARGWQLIHVAAASGDADFIKLVLAKGGDAKSLTTPPPVAQQKGVMYAALLTGPSPVYGRTFQVAAAGSANPKQPAKAEAQGVKRRPLEAFEYLLPPPAAPTPAILLAASSGSVEAMKVLIEAGADPKVKAADGLTLALASARGGSLEALKFALAIDPDIHARAQGGRSIMHMVVENRTSTEYEPMITFLADKGAELNVVDERRVSPGSFVNRVGPEKLRVFYIQLLKDRKVNTARAPDEAGPFLGNDAKAKAKGAKPAPKDGKIPG